MNTMGFLALLWFPSYSRKFRGAIFSLVLLWACYFFLPVLVFGVVGRVIAVFVIEESPDSIEQDAS